MVRLSYKELLIDISVISRSLTLSREEFNFMYLQSLKKKRHTHAKNSFRKIYERWIVLLYEIFYSPRIRRLLYRASLRYAKCAQIKIWRYISRRYYNNVSLVRYRETQSTGDYDFHCVSSVIWLFTRCYTKYNDELDYDGARYRNV